jgi:hypothetical protein
MNLEKYLEIDKQNFESPNVNWGDHPLHWLARYCEFNQKQLESAIKLYGVVDPLNNYKQTPLIAAAHSLWANSYPYFGWQSCLDICRCLIEKGANLKLADIRGWTATQYTVFWFMGIYAFDEQKQTFDLWENIKSEEANFHSLRREIIQLFHAHDRTLFNSVRSHPAISMAVNSYSIDDVEFFMNL